MHRVGFETTTPVFERNAVTMYGEMEVQLNRADEGESSASKCARVTPGNRAPCTQWIDWVDLRVDLEAV